MLRNYFTIGARQLLRHKLFTVVNVAGLAIGLAAFLLMNEYVRFERSYDRFFAHADRLYRVSSVSRINGSAEVKDAMSYYPVGAALTAEVPEVEAATTSLKFDEVIFRKGEHPKYERGVVTADSNFLNLLTYRVLEGARESMLRQPHCLVLTESKAREYFGDESALGKILEVEGEPYTVTGVMEDVPDNTHYTFEILMSDKSIQDRFDYNSWRYFDYYTFVRLAPHADPKALQAKLDALSAKYLSEGNLNRFVLYPLSDIHLKSDFTFEPELTGSARAVSMVQLISVFMLVIAWVNYINLSTARAVERAKEVGLRKVIGARQSHLIGQFLFEALLVNLLAAGLAFLLAELALPLFNVLVGKRLKPTLEYAFWGNLLLFFGIGTFVSGFYPALVLSGFKPTVVLKGRFHASQRGVWLRKGLLVVQFAASIGLIAATGIVYRQVQFMQARDMGIETAYVMGVTLPAASRVEEQPTLDSKVAAFHDKLRYHAAIEAVGTTSNLPGGGASDINTTTSQMRIVELTDRVEGTYYTQNNDEHFLEAVGLHLMAGRNFDRNQASDSAAVMVNEAFLRHLNVADPHQALGKSLQFGTDDESPRFPIVGIVRDFNRTTLKHAVEPSIYFYAPSNARGVIKLHPDRYQTGLAYVQKTWAQFFPNTPFAYTFLDDRFALLYEQDRRFVDIFGAFSGLTICITLLGLFGLASFLAVQRTKEVGVRKVLGATIPSIIVLFYKDFLILLGIAALVGLPVVYWGMTSWLENYAFRIAFPWLLTAGALGIVGLFALATVGYQMYSVAALDPAQTLKYE
ncbi:putative ABC transport system permease protein [Catalinimonas alkaloidigena]|uniref:Putative ABC transport system permease protein n=1 Tax=Catalinimonas alkaloidigena TaxID=1075417 RepID=A0A1G9N9X0_9BACT|nr:ABC transporter permease [Catalinimonas alkaloidigena]SDL82685.1 putative ABC transport system permease protein [Catalinimonas alkaloidigena]